MGKYNFDQEVSRYGTSCIKYDYGMERMGRTDLLPMWVADMDFKLPDEILEEFHKRIDHGIFGYTDPDQEYWDALNHWASSRNGYTINPEHVTLGAGIVYGLATAVTAYTEPGDAVLIQQPVYYPFRNVIECNGREFINSQLHYENGRYTIDFADFEQKIIDHQVKVFILCNPHNPIGRVWTREELIRLADICLKHGVIMLDDEIHSDLIYPGNTFTSMMNLDEKYHDNLVLFLSPSKTFNVAGFQPANIIIPNAELRAKYRVSNDASAYSNGALMGQVAVKACYTKGAQWVDELLVYLQGNMEYVRDFVKENFPKATFVEPEGTYLIWIDFSGYGFTDEELEHIMVEEAKLWLDSGKIFGPETAQFERFNIACPRSTVVRAMEQLKTAIDSHKKEN
ncbi:L-cysteine desulfhydrase [Streptococcus varani]|uniref:cysteine-S-conjugate beta-lyase n=1 Tax=Streptococcus varani TaxID=1608583 RepID=A0A0E4CRQ3_9STRE|nr:MalY/PatB family protein [Streptococcus varani]CQR23641.1 L-cysteine desulfhydrase [Streptococcus varani]